MTTKINTSNIQSAALAFIQGPVVSSIEITNSSYTVLNDTAVDTAGGYIKITGVNFVAGMSVLIGSLTATSVSVVSSTVLNVQVPAQSAGSYIVYVVAPDGGVGIVVNGLTYSGFPTWVTGSTLTQGAVDTAISIQLDATGASNYSLAAGSSLPAGLSLTSGGLLSGTVTGITVETLYNFTIEATDTELQDSPRSFTITITANDQYFPYVTTLLSANTPASTFVTDASANSFAITINGDTKPNNFNPYTPGYYSNYFDGNGDNLYVPSNAALAFGSSDFCLEYWIYPTVFGTNDRPLGNNTGWAANSWGLHINLLAVNIVQKHSFWVYNHNNNGAMFTSTQSVVLNTWTHVAITRSGNSWRMFINGVQEGSTVTSSAALDGGSSDDLYIGGVPNEYVTGYMSNVRAVKGSAVYTSNFTPSTTPFTAIANTSLLTCQSNRFIDNSTNNFAITRTGDVAVSGFVPFTPNSSYATYGSGYFDGSGDWLAVPINATFAFGTNNYTYEAWVYPTAFSNAYNTIFCNFRDDEGTKGWSLLITGAGLIHVNNQGTYNDSANALLLNTWTHVAVCRVGNTVTRYINGVADPTTLTVSANITNVVSQGPTIGGSPEYPATRGWTGYISNARVISGTALYTSNFTPSTTPFTAIANTSLLTLQTNQPNNNNMFLDNSSNNFLITRNGNTTQGTFSPYGGGWSNYFDGNGDYLQAGTNSNLALGSSNFTIEGWHYCTGYNGGGTLYSTINTYPSSTGLLFYISNIGVYTIDVNGTILAGSGTAVLNAWIHWAVVRNGSTLSIYINGTSIGSVSSSTNFTDQYAVIGRTGAGANSNLFLGYLSNTHMVKGTAVYTANFTPPTVPLTAIANTSLLTCQSNRFIDNSSNNFTITRNGDVSVQRFNPFNPVITTPTSYSGYFDGNGDYLTTPSNAALAFGSSDFCLEFWIYTTAFGSTDSRPLGNHNGWGANAWSLHSDHTAVNEKYTLWVHNYNSGSAMLTSTSSVALNTWTHVAITRSGNSWRMFINGVQEGSTVTSSAALDGGSSDDLYIGGSGSANEYVTGYMSNVRAVKGSAVYTSNFTPSTTPLTAIANTSLLTLQSPTFIDNSTNNFTLTANGNTAPRQFNPFGVTNTTSSSAAYTTALYGGSAYFDGTGDFAAISSTANAILTANSNFTLELWVYVTGSPGTYNTFFGGTTNDFVLAHSTQSNWGIYIAKAGLAPFITTGMDAYNELFNRWNHLAVTRSGNNWNIWLNGVSRAAVTDAITFTNAQKAIGAESNGGSPMQGYISNIRYISAVLYTSNFTPPTAPLTSQQNTVLLNNMTGAGIYDSSMMANYETVGNAQISTSVKKYGTGSMSFDGNGDYLYLPPSQNFAFGSGNFTIEFWGYNLTQAGNWGVFSFGATVGSDYAGITMNGGGGLYISTGGGAWQYSNAGGITLSTNDNQWHHYAIVRSVSQILTYKDGVQQGTFNIAGSLVNNAGAAVIGAKSDALSNNMTGYLDDFRITKGYARYTSNFTPTATPFIRF